MLAFRTTGVPQFGIKMKETKSCRQLCGAGSRLIRLVRLRRTLSDGMTSFSPWQGHSGYGSSLPTTLAPSLFDPLTQVMEHMSFKLEKRVQTG